MRVAGAAAGVSSLIAPSYGGRRRPGWAGRRARSLPSGRILLTVTVTTADFRTAMCQFATGVAVVTTLDADRPAGITVNALASVSLEPPLVVVALDRGRFIVPMLAATRRFAINILAEDQQGLSDCFAGADVTPNRDAFCGAAWRPGTTGMPVLDGAIAVLECAVVQTVDVGDHALWIGQVEALTIPAPHAHPLLYHRRRYLRIERASTTPVVGKPEHRAG